MVKVTLLTRMMIIKSQKEFLTFNTLALKLNSLLKLHNLK